MAKNPRGLSLVLEYVRFALHIIFMLSLERYRMFARIIRIVPTACLALVLSAGLVPAASWADDEAPEATDPAVTETDDQADDWTDEDVSSQDDQTSEAPLPEEGEEEPKGDEGEGEEGEPQGEFVDLGDERVTVTLEKDSVTFNGAEQKPAVAVAFDGEELEEGVHYTVEYADNINAGTARAVVSGIEEAGYTGSVTVEFTIKPASLAKAVLSTTAYTYNGKAHAPIVKVAATIDGKAKKIFSGRTTNDNVKVTYSGKRVNVGTYKVTIVGQGNYKGTLTKYFKVNPAGVAQKTPKAWSRAVQVSWAKRTKQVTGYQIRVSRSSSMAKSKIFTVKNDKITSRRISGMRKYTRYYLQVRTYAKTSSGKVYYSKWSKRESVKTVHPTLSEGVGITREQLVASLQRHRNDGYYLGTPWTMGSGSYNNNIWANGHPRSDGYCGFNCGGFVTRAFLDAGANLNGIARVAAASSSPGMGTSGALSWFDYAKKMGYKVTYYSSVNEMLKSGDLRKGDIVFTHPVSWGDPDADTHIMIFWGDNSHDNKVWQTSGPYNNIGPVKLGCTRSYLYVISMGA